MAQTLHYAAGVLGMNAPPTFLNPNDGGGMSFLHGQPPSMVLGHAALTADAPPQAPPHAPKEPHRPNAKKAFQ